MGIGIRFPVIEQGSLSPQQWDVNLAGPGKTLRFAAWPATNWNNVVGLGAPSTVTGSTNNVNEGGPCINFGASLDRIEYTIDETQIFGVGNLCTMAFSYKNTADTMTYKRLLDTDVGLGFQMFFDNVASNVALYGPNLVTDFWTYAAWPTPLKDGLYHRCVLHIDWSTGGASTLYVDGQPFAGTLNGTAMAKPTFTSFSLATSTALRQPEGDLGYFMVFNSLVSPGLLTQDPFFALRRRSVVFSVPSYDPKTRQDFPFSDYTPSHRTHEIVAY